MENKNPVTHVCDLKLEKKINTELGAGRDLCHPIEKHGRSQRLPGAGQDDGNMQK